MNFRIDSNCAQQNFVSKKISSKIGYDLNENELSQNTKRNAFHFAELQIGSEYTSNLHPTNAKRIKQEQYANQLRFQIEQKFQRKKMKMKKNEIGNQSISNFTGKSFESKI